MCIYTFKKSSQYDTTDLDTIETLLNSSENQDSITHYPHQISMMRAGEILLKHLNKNNLHGVFCAINISNIEQASIYEGANKTLNIWREVLDTIYPLLPQNAYIGKVHFGIALHFWEEEAIIISETELLLNKIQYALNTLQITTIKNEDTAFHLTLFSKIGYISYPKDTGKLNSYLPLTKYAVISTIDTLNHDYHSSITRFTQSHYDTLQEKILLESKIFKQASLKQFQLYYQTQINLETKQMIGAEVLSHFNQMPSSSYYNTEHYIQLLENSKYIIEFTYASFEKLIHFLDTNLSSLPQGFLLGFNLSRSVFQWSDFELITMIQSIVKEKTHLIPYIQIEMTESAYLSKDSSSKVLQTIQKLHFLGFKISIDDFGTGYGSLIMLSSGYIDCIKLDRSITKQLCNHDINTVFIDSLLYAAKENNFKVVVEGIETQKEEDTIKALGLKYVQGYRYSKNISEKDFLILLEK